MFHKYIDSAGLLFLKVCCVALIALTLVSCDSMDEKKAKYVNNGKAYYAEEEYLDARIQFIKALRIDSHYIEARFWLGKTYEKLENNAASIVNYKMTIEEDVTFTQAYLNLSGIYLQDKKYDKALNIVNSLLEIDSDNADAYSLKSSIYIEKGEPEKAIQEAKQALKYSPGHVDALELVASGYMALSQPTRAIELLEGGINKNPENVDLIALLGQAYSSNKQYVDSISTYLKLVSLAPDNVLYRNDLAKSYMRIKDPDNAEKTLRNAVTDNPDNIEAKLLLVDYLANKQDKTQAEKDLLVYVKSEDRVDELYFRLAEFYESNNENKKAKDVYMDIISSYSDYPNKLKANIRLSKIWLKEGNYEKSVELAKDILEEHPKYYEALLLLGKISLVRYDPQDAIVKLRVALTESSAPEEVLHLLALAHIFNGEPDLARSILQKSIIINPEYTQSRLDLARLFIQSGRYNLAIKQFSKVLEKDPGNIIALSGISSLLIKKQNWNALNDILNKTASTHPEYILVNYLKGILLKEKGKKKKSIEQFEKALKKAPGAIEPLSSLVDVYVENNDIKSAIDRINLSIDESPDNISAYSLLEHMHRTLKEDKEIGLSMIRLLAKYPKLASSYRNYGLYLLVKGKKQEAINIFFRGTRNIPNDLSLYFMLASSYQRAGEHDNAGRTYERILEINPHFDVAANNLAVFLSNKTSDRSSQERALVLAKRFSSSDNPVFLDTLGWVYYQLGEMSKAIAMFGEAVLRRPDIPEFRYHLGMAYYKNGNSLTARRHLELAVDTDDDYPGKDKAKEILNKI